MKTKITFKLLNETNIAILHDNNIVGQIYSEQTDGTTPYPHDNNTATLESIQICGFVEASKMWSCGVFHGTRDIVLRFNPMQDKFYVGYHDEYKRYIEECFKHNKPQLIKSFNDWVSHMGYPSSEQLRSSERKNDILPVS